MTCTPSSSIPPGCILQVFAGIGPGDIPRRANAEEEDTAETDCREVGQHTRVDGEVIPVRPVRLRHGSKPEPHTKHRHADAPDTAERRQQYALDHELPYDAPAGRAERCPDRDLVRSVCRTREE